MLTSEAFLIRKTPYGDADYVLTLFTKDFGKISGFAKHARRSRKRFGGRLEPFIQFRVRMKDKPRDMFFIEDAETVKVYHSFIENIELFLWGSFMLESLDALLPKDSPSGELFDVLVRAFTALDEGKSVFPVVLDFSSAPSPLRDTSPISIRAPYVINPLRGRDASASSAAGSYAGIVKTRRETASGCPPVSSATGSPWRFICQRCYNT